MRRLLLCVAALAIGLVSPAAAEADVDMCYGSGTMTTAVGLGTRGVHGPRTTSFTVLLGNGTCLGKAGPLSFTGTLTGWCLDAWGYGVDHRGHDFLFTMTSGGAAYYGEMKAVGLVLPLPTVPGSCTTATATTFLATAYAQTTHTFAVHLPPPWREYCAQTTTEC